jgi:hypothetical protein
LTRGVFAVILYILFVGSIVNLCNCCYLDSTRLMCMLRHAHFAWWAFPKRHRANCGAIAIIRKVPVLGHYTKSRRLFYPLCPSLFSLKPRKHQATRPSELPPILPPALRAPTAPQHATVTQSALPPSPTRSPPPPASLRHICKAPGAPHHRKFLEAEANLLEP